MTRFLRGTIPVWCAILLVAPAAAAPPEGSPVLTITGEVGRRIIVEVPPPASSPGSITAHAQVSKTLYLERCTGGCRLRMGPNDARAGTTMLLLVQSATIGEFASSIGLTGASADDEWDQVVQCMKEVYSPYDVNVTDVKPAATASYHEAIIAGRPETVGRASDILGVAPLANDCSAIDNVISLSFANQHMSSSASARVLSICWTAAQESAHAFGLDHEYAFVKGNRSACNDPMTYRSDCGGQKFFRNEPATCGENTARACRCGASQNSHAKLLSVFGAGAPITRKPTVTLVSPRSSDGAFGAAVKVDAGAQRGIARVELELNGYSWTDQPGAAFGKDGQPDPTSYTIGIPADLPNSIIDVRAVAYDDLDVSTGSTTVTVTKGAPCATAATCATGQKCEAGKCFWDPPAGELGDDCTYSQFCKSRLCQSDGDQQLCTQTCEPGAADACPADFECVGSSATKGACYPAASGGCCSVDRDGRGGWAQLGIGLAALAFAIRKRRR